MRSSYKQRAGDRKDGRLLRSLSAFNRFLPLVMPRTSDACKYYEESFEITAADKCLRQERVAGQKGISFLHFFIAAYIRCVSMLPGVNRFVAGRRIYARNSITVVLAVKRSLAIDTSDTTIKVEFEPTDTIFDVKRKIDRQLNEIKSGDVEDEAEKMIETIGKLPRILARLVIFVLRIMDFYGWIPTRFMEFSPFHASMTISDTGSLRIGPMFHQINNFGNIPLFVSFSAKRHVYELDRHGESVSRRYIDAKFTMDGRTVDDHYYAQFLQAMRYIFAHPEILERSPTRVIEDVG